ncbi:MAG: uroporphyrinogen decarboxylase family protein [Phycisphaerae bacterium]
MKPREIIQRNLQLADPVRIGFAFGENRIDDFLGGGVEPSVTWKRHVWIEDNFEYSEDEWGNVWHRIVGKSVRGEIHTPVLDDWAKLKNYRLPDLDDPKRYEKTQKAFAQETERFRLGYLPGFPFAICRYMRKMEIYFQDLVLEREHVDDLHERVTGLLERMIFRLADAGADGIFFAEDWGIQDRLLISPTMWREIFKPLYKRLCKAAHTRDLFVLMHSCGYNWEILDDLAEVGVNAFQFDQPGLYGLERLAEKLQRLKVCLFSPVDIQKILPTGDRACIEAEAKKMVQLFGHHGGLIACNYGDLSGIGVKPEWDQWAYETFVREGKGVGLALA